MHKYIYMYKYRVHGSQKKKGDFLLGHQEKWVNNEVANKSKIRNSYRKTRGTFVRARVRHVITKSNLIG